MNEAIQNQYGPDFVSPPGETLLETLEQRGMSQAELADRTGRPKKTINEIIKGKASITPKTALQLEMVLGVPASFWNNRERQYREALARLEERRRLESEIEWLKNPAIVSLTKLGWVRRFRDKVEQVKEVLNFFGVTAPEQLEKLASKYSEQQIAFRRSRAFQSNPLAVMAWLRKGEIEAHNIDCTPYGQAKFKKALLNARQLTDKAPEIFLPEIVRMCAETGVALVFIPELPGTKTSGATCWLTPKKALIQISFRYKTDDQFWFTFFHESAHILSHGKLAIFLEDENAHDDLEQEADRFAEQILIPKDRLAEFANRERICKNGIKHFASELKIAPGIVVGRLQHEGFLPHSHCNDLKIRFKWSKNPTG
jgi:HTH-type transcriptional regulator/antitoxin HigA